MAPPDSEQLKGNNAIEIIEWLACHWSRETSTHLVRHAAEGLLGAHVAKYRTVSGLPTIPELMGTSAFMGTNPENGAQPKGQ